MNHEQGSLAPEGEGRESVPSYGTTRAFLVERLSEARHGDGLPTELEPGVEYPLAFVDLPSFSKDPQIDARTRNAIGIFFSTELSYRQVGERLGNISKRKKRVGEMVRDGVRILHETASDELREKYPLEALGFSREPKMQRNMLGKWIEEFRSSRGVGLADLMEKFGMPGLNMIGYKPIHDISVNTLDRVREQVRIHGGTEEDLASLEEVITSIKEETMREKGRLYDRVPPSLNRKPRRRKNWE